jgi:hypothetical protein
MAGGSGDEMPKVPPAIGTGGTRRKVRLAKARAEAKAASEAATTMAPMQMQMAGGRDDEDTDATGGKRGRNDDGTSRDDEGTDNTTNLNDMTKERTTRFSVPPPSPRLCAQRLELLQMTLLSTLTDVQKYNDVVACVKNWADIDIMSYIKVIHDTYGSMPSSDEETPAPDAGKRRKDMETDDDTWGQWFGGKGDGKGQQGGAGPSTGGYSHGDDRTDHGRRRRSRPPDGPTRWQQSLAIRAAAAAEQARFAEVLAERARRSARGLSSSEDIGGY